MSKGIFFFFFFLEEAFWSQFVSKYSYIADMQHCNHKAYKLSCIPKRFSVIYGSKLVELIQSIITLTDNAHVRR